MLTVATGTFWNERKPILLNGSLRVVRANPGQETNLKSDTNYLDQGQKRDFKSTKSQPLRTNINYFVLPSLLKELIALSKSPNFEALR